MPSALTEAEKRYVSELSDPRQRFLARVIDHALEDGWRTPDDFLRHFPPSAIVSSLATADDLRVKLLVATTGTHEKIARKKSVGSATEDLELALAENTTTPAALSALYPADDKVRYLDPKKLWTFLVEDHFYEVTDFEDGTRHGRAAKRLAFMVECAIEEGLIALRDVADGMTFDEIASSLPVQEVRDLVRHALEIARSGTPLTEERFLAVVPLPALIAHVRLAHTWERVIVERVAVPAAFTEGPTKLVAPAPEEAPPKAAEAAPPPAVLDVPAASPAIDAAVAAPAADPSRVPDEDDVRRRVIERLRVIDRLPPNHGELGTPILLSVESMYADLWAVSDDDEREACIRESFPNEQHLRTAMLSLIELLDPSVDTKDPIIRDADIAGLVKIVLFEERRRRDPSPSPRKSAATPSSQRARRSVPPPLPRSSTPPPLPGADVPRGSNPPPLPAEAAGGKRDR